MMRKTMSLEEAIVGSIVVVCGLFEWVVIFKMFLIFHKQNQTKLILIDLFIMF